MGTIRGKRGNDTLVGTKRDDFIDGREGNDTLYGREGNDHLFGQVGNDTMYGELGDDFLRGDAGDDYLDGGDGNDTATGGDGNDTVLGGTGNDIVTGLMGDDVLVGGDGDDELFGWFGSDTFTGGTGADKIQFDMLSDSDATNGIDLITDFEDGIDELWTGPATDANVGMAGQQEWDFVGTTAGAPPANGNGQATIGHADGLTVLNLYNNDGDAVADFTLVFAGFHEQIQILGWVEGSPSGSFSNPLINYAEIFA